MKIELKQAVLFSAILLLANGASAETVNYRNLLGKAKNLANQNKNLEAQKLYSKIVPELAKKYGVGSPYVHQAYLDWAKNSQKMNRHVRAINLLERLKLWTKDKASEEQIKNLLAYSYMKVNQPEKAIPLYKECIELSGKFKFQKVFYFKQLGHAYEKNGDLKDAELSFKKAVELANFDLGPRDKYVAEMKKHPMGEKHALVDSVDTNILELVDSIHSLASFNLRHGKLEGAKVQFVKALRIDNVWVPVRFKKPSLYFDYSTLLKKSNKLKEAQKYENKGLELRKYLASQKGKLNSN